MTQDHGDILCPACGEPVRENWKICPACERPLRAPVCPGCGIPVKAHWKRCPECETPLLCRSCGSPIPPGHTRCPECAPEGPGPGPRLEPFTDPLTGMVFCHVPPGSFMMGDTFGEGIENERPVRPVRLDGFYMAQFPVTQAQWTALMEENPSKFPGDLHPLEQVTWHEALAFARRMTEACGGAYIFDLPTEAQWEYAARSGGRQELYAGGNNVNALAWYEENSGGTTRPVGTRAPNGLGLYDLSGNVWEWCRDTFHPDAYKRLREENPLLEEGGQERVIRGGSWNLDAWSARCARRFSLRSDLSGPALGFRLVALPK